MKKSPVPAGRRGLGPSHISLEALASQGRSGRLESPLCHDP